MKVFCTGSDTINSAFTWSCYEFRSRAHGRRKTRRRRVRFNTTKHLQLRTISFSSPENIMVDSVDLAPVRTNDSSTMLSVHRLTQLAYREHQKSCQVETFIRVCRILRDLFPRQDKGFTLFNHWIDCEQLAEHVQIFCERYPPMCQTNQSII
ncbi:hypothetical protein ACQKWADRAFT_129609 [Trichoderma austrokoningii]